MKIIQIEITNACINQCSNCTRFCGHYEKPFFMDFETFKVAVDSLKNYKGMVGIMGGEPTLHPEFERLIEYYVSARPDVGLSLMFKHPVRDFNTFLQKRLNVPSFRKRGLFSALGSKYYEHFETIQDVFSYQCINDHKNSGLHQPLLISRKELGIPDDEWFRLRDRCGLQNEWSASITPKGAFFCEIAASLDMLFEGPGGWKVEPGWWMRMPVDFKDQLHWCELCSAALAVPANPGAEEIDIISPMLLEKIKIREGSYKVKNNKYRIFDPTRYDKNKIPVSYKHDPHLGSGDKRVSSDTNLSLFPKKIDIVFSANKPQDIPLLPDICKVISMKQAGRFYFEDWLLVVNDTACFTPAFLKNLSTMIFNPGVLYYPHGREFFFINRNVSGRFKCRQVGAV